MNHVAFVMKSIASHPMPAAIDYLSRERSRLRQRVENHQIQNQIADTPTPDLPDQAGCECD